jgi:hypothetical protein
MEWTSEFVTDAAQQIRFCSIRYSSVQSYDFGHDAVCESGKEAQLTVEMKQTSSQVCPCKSRSKPGLSMTVPQRDEDEGADSREELS